MNALLRPVTEADLADVLALNEQNVELLAPLDEARLRELLDWADSGSVIDVDGAFAGFVLTFVSGSSYDGENFAWFAQRYPDFAYLDRVVIHGDFRRRGLGTQVYDELEGELRTSGVRPRGQPRPAQRAVTGLPPRSWVRRGRPTSRPAGDTVSDDGEDAGDRRRRQLMTTRATRSVG